MVLSIATELESDVTNKEMSDADRKAFEAFAMNRPGFKREWLVRDSNSPGFYAVFEVNIELLAFQAALDYLRKAQK